MGPINNGGLLDAKGLLRFNVKEKKDYFVVS
jgi:hypothetical protein